MKAKQITSIAAVALMAASMGAPAGAADESTTDYGGITLTLMNSKPEIQSELEKVTSALRAALSLMKKSPTPGWLFSSVPEAIRLFRYCSTVSTLWRASGRPNEKNGRTGSCFSEQRS